MARPLDPIRVVKPAAAHIGKVSLLVKVVTFSSATIVQLSV
jgi:hypothetical protein